MNKLLAAIVLIVSGALIAGAYLSSGTDDEPSSTNTSQASIAEADNDESIELEDAGSRGILEYSEAALAESDTDKNILFFHAQWCTVCKSVERNIEAASIPDDISIFLVDYDSDEGQALAAKHNIPIQYTMVQVDNQGKEITQWVNNFGDGLVEISEQLAAL
jgi:thiol-disulfide isomerase/thioredoxin